MSIWAPFEVLLGPFEPHLRSFLGPFEVHLRSILSRFLVDFRSLNCALNSLRSLQHRLLMKNLFFFFAVPSVSISGEKEMHVEAGSSVVLKCSVSDYLQRPTFIFWYRNNERLVNGLSGISITDNVDSTAVVTSSSASTQPWTQDSNLYSILTVKEASSKFSGRYSCVPDNLRPASINVHVILGKILAKKSVCIESELWKSRLGFWKKLKNCRCPKYQFRNI